MEFTWLTCLLERSWRVEKIKEMLYIPEMIIYVPIILMQVERKLFEFLINQNKKHNISSSCS